MLTGEMARIFTLIGLTRKLTSIVTKIGVSLFKFRKVNYDA